MNVAQEIVARSYVAGPEVSDPPELIGPVDGVANPAGKSDSGSSTDSSCVPVSCPDAAASGVIEVVGSAADGVLAPADADAVADGDPVADGDALADGDGAAADVEELPADEHPASAVSAPATAASAARPGRTRRTATDDTALPTQDVDLDT